METINWKSVGYGLFVGVLILIFFGLIALAGKEIYDYGYKKGVTSGKAQGYKKGLDKGYSDAMKDIAPY